MKTCVALLIALLTAQLAQAANVTGAGSSFIYPVLSKWIDTYHKETGKQINYQPIGSGGGIQTLTSGMVTFAASDKPLSPDTLKQKGWAQWPMIVGGIVMVVNIPGVESNALTLDGDTLAGIFMGKIRFWNDEAITKLNPDVKLPKRNITVVHRADGSGTTFNFTDYLTKVNKDWKEKIGCDTVVSWPAGVGGKGNAGVANFVQTIPYSIGYVEYAYALQNKLSTTQLINREGKTVSPSLDTFQSAAANAEWMKTSDYYLILTNQPGAESWPIVATTFVLMPKQPKDIEGTKTALEFMDWAYTNGADTATKLDYVSIPSNVVEVITSYWNKSIIANGNPLWVANTAN